MSLVTREAVLIDDGGGTRWYCWRHKGCEDGVDVLAMTPARGHRREPRARASENLRRHLLRVHGIELPEGAPARQYVLPERLR